MKIWNFKKKDCFEEFSGKWNDFYFLRINRNGQSYDMSRSQKKLFFRPRRYHRICPLKGLVNSMSMFLALQLYSRLFILLISSSFLFLHFASYSLTYMNVTKLQQVKKSDFRGWHCGIIMDSCIITLCVQHIAFYFIESLLLCFLRKHYLKHFHFLGYDIHDTLKLQLFISLHPLSGFMLWRFIDKDNLWLQIFTKFSKKSSCCLYHSPSAQPIHKL